MINFYDYANENKTEHNLKWPYIPDHPYRILIIGSDCNWTRTQNHLVLKRRPSLAKWLSVRLRTKWFWV